MNVRQLITYLQTVPDQDMEVHVPEHWSHEEDRMVTQVKKAIVATHGWDEEAHVVVELLT